MKKIINLLILSIFIISVFSCDNQDQEQLIITASGAGEITSPETGTVYVLNPLENQTNTIFTLTWSDANFDVPTEINYSVEFAVTGTNFETPLVAGETTNTFLTWNIGEFNSIVSGAGLPPFAEGSLDVRVVATVGSVSSTPQISQPITILVTPFTTELPKIAVPGNHQGWDPPTAPILASSAFGETDYVGYVWLDGEYKFIAPNTILEFEWGNIDWGDDDTFTGTLLETDEVNCNASTAGYYLLNVDTDALTYSAQLTNWGLIGSATPDNWSSDQDMTYDAGTATWTITLDLSAEEIKFRANDDWTLNLGDNDADLSLEQDGANISVPSAGNYTVVLDLSTPREYTYSLTLN
ncbi:MAG: SusE domain-containing protein [Flavobacteriaceae bacterium]|nr:SusE domain-containing protein [Flavobacteriaceae bacterium]